MKEREALDVAIQETWPLMRQEMRQELVIFIEGWMESTERRANEGRSDGEESSSGSADREHLSVYL